MSLDSTVGEGLSPECSIGMKELEAMMTINTCMAAANCDKQGQLLYMVQNTHSS